MAAIDLLLPLQPVGVCSRDVTLLPHHSFTFLEHHSNPRKAWHVAALAALILHPWQRP